MNVKQYDGTALIKATAEEIKSAPDFATPEWAKFVKTGINRQRPPIEEDWWQTRVASILRKVAILGPVGVSKLRRKYGGKYRRGYQPSTSVKGSGKIVRVALQQLEKAGYIKQAVVDGHKGRVLDTNGVKLLAKVAKTIKTEEANGEQQAPSTETKTE